MKKLVSIIFVLTFVLVSINSVLAANIAVSPNHEMIAQLEQECLRYKNNPVVKEGLTHFNKQFLESIIYIRRYPNMMEQSVNNPHFEWVAMFKVRQLLIFALADPKANVRVISWRNYQGFSIQLEAGQESMGFLFDLDGQSAFLADYSYISGDIQRNSTSDNIMISKMILTYLEVCSKRAEKALKK